MKSQPQNPEFRNYLENFHPCTHTCVISTKTSCTGLYFGSPALSRIMKLQENNTILPSPILKYQTCCQHFSTKILVIRQSESAVV